MGFLTMTIGFDVFFPGMRFGLIVGWRQLAANVLLTRLRSEPWALEKDTLSPTCQQVLEEQAP